MIDDILINEQLRKIDIRIDDVRKDINRKGHTELSQRLAEIQADIQDLQVEIRERRKF